MASKGKFQAAKELIQLARYDEARTLLESMGNDERAQKWLKRLDNIAPETRADRRQRRRQSNTKERRRVGCGAVLRSCTLVFSCGALLITTLAFCLLANLLNLALMQPVNQTFASLGNTQFGGAVNGAVSSTFERAAVLIEPRINQACEAATSDAQRSEVCQSVSQDLLNCMGRYGLDINACTDRVGVSVCNNLYDTRAEQTTCLEEFSQIDINSIIESLQNGQPLQSQ